MICSALFDLNVIWSELKMEWLWLSLLSSKNFHLLLLSSRWTHLQLYIHAIERCIIANMLQQYENIKRYIFKNNGYSRIYELYHIINRPLNIIYHFYIFEIRIRGTTRSTLSDIFERTTSSAKHPHSSVYAHSARLARHAHYPPLSLLNQDQRKNQTTSPNRIPIWIFMEKVQDQRNIHITRHLPKQIHYDHIILSIVIFLTIPAQSLSHTRLLTWE